MRIRCLAISLLALLGGGFGTAQEPPLRLGGWVAYWGREDGLRSVRQAKGALSDVFLFAVQFDDQGNPVLAMPARELESVLSVLRKQKSTLWLTVVNDRIKSGAVQLKDTDLTHALMADPARRRKHIQSLLELCRTYRVAGLDVDYENLDFADKDLFSSFIKDLSIALKPGRFALSVTVQPKFRDSRSRGPGGADWAALGKVVDRLQIMLYNQHNLRTAPGPVSEPEWIGKVLDYAVTQCDPAKIVPVLKVSGYEWGSTPRETTFHELEAKRRAVQGVYQRDPLGKAPFLVFKVEGEQRTAYVEDAISLRTKVDFMRSKGFDKVVLWRLGVEDPAFWEQAPEGAEPHT